MTSNDWDRDEKSALEPFEDELRALRDRHASDPPLDVLRAVDGEVLPDDLQASASAHLAKSRWSRALVEGAIEGSGGLSTDDEARLLARITRESRASGERSGWQSRAWWGLLAAGSVAAIAFVMVQRSAQPASTTEVANQTANSAPAPAFVLALAKPDVKISPGALIFRGNANEQAFLSDLKPALDAFRQSEYARADREFAALAPRYPKSVEVPFYQGVARIYLNDLTGADTSLTAAEQLNDASFGLEVMWYRAIVDERAGRAASARTRLDTLCKDDRFVHQAQACDAASRLR